MSEIIIVGDGNVGTRAAEIIAALRGAEVVNTVLEIWEELKETVKELSRPIRDELMDLMALLRKETFYDPKPYLNDFPKDYFLKDRRFVVCKVEPVPQRHLPYQRHIY